MSDKHVPIFFLTDCLYGGWRIYTAHLMRALRAAKLEPRIYRMGNRNEPGMRDFHYGERYQNVTRDTAYGMAEKFPSLVAAFDKNYISEMIGLHASGSYVMIHDEDEIIKTLHGYHYIQSAMESLGEHRIMTNRKNGIAKKGAQVILHPFDTEGFVCQKTDLSNVRDHRTSREHRCISVARIDNDKRTEFLFDVNRLIKDPKNKIQIRGYDGRVYGRKFLKLHYPEYKMSSYEFPKDSVYGGAALCNTAEFSIDVSRITGEGAGGGTQYTFLESMMCGVPVIIHEDWIRPGGEMVPGENCLIVKNPQHCANVLEMKVYDSMYNTLVQGGYHTLKNHAPLKIGNQFKKEFDKWRAQRK